MAAKEISILLPLAHAKRIREIPDLKSISGLKDYELTKDNHLRIQYDDRNVLIEVEKLLSTAGIKIASIQNTLPVLDMNCASCAISIESMLKNEAGVLSAEVSYANNQVNLAFIPEVTDLPRLRQAVRSIGFDLDITAETEHGENKQDHEKVRYDRLKRKTIWAMILAAPVFVIGMFFMHMPYGNQVSFLFTTVLILWVGRDFYVNAWKKLMHRTANMDTLVALSTGVAYIFSVFNMVYPTFWIDRGMEAHVYFEAAAVIIAFILLGKLLEERAKGSASDAIKKLMGLQPKTVSVVDEAGKEHTMPISQIAIGQQIIVKPGEKVAVDGKVIRGSSFVDESMLTGEPIPVKKEKGEKVYAGTINQRGSFHFSAEKVGQETLLAQIVEVVRKAQGSKAPVQQLVDKIAGIFVPIVIGIATVSFVLWITLGGENNLTQGLLAFITVLVIACPCALGLATPTAIMVGIGKGADQGILIKDAISLEKLKNVDTVVLDKTGTITEGKPVVLEEYWTEGDPTHKHILGSIEQRSAHPLADAISQHLHDFAIVDLQDFESITGKGVSARSGKSTYFVGNQRLLDEQPHLSIPEDMLSIAAEWKTKAYTLVWFASDRRVLALLAIADDIKETSREAIRKLINMGIRPIMLTGDIETTAIAVAHQVGIQEVQAGVLPDEKAAIVRSWQVQGHTVAMVGDGVNDSGALAQADVSIAMGKGSDIAMDVAKMTIISSDLLKIPQAIHLSQLTSSAIRQNLFWAFIYNIIGIPIAAGILYPINGFMLSPMIASAAMALSSVSVVANSLRLRWKTL